MRTLFKIGLLSLAILFASSPLVTHAKQGSDSKNDTRLEDSIEIGSDDGTPDQGKGDAVTTSNMTTISADDDGTPDQGRGDFGVMESASSPSDDDNTLDQGKGDFNTLNTLGGSDDNSSSGSHKSADDNNDEESGSSKHFMQSLRTWLLRWFQW